jgi:hypothetical protein
MRAGLVNPFWQERLTFSFSGMDGADAGGIICLKRRQASSTLRCSRCADTSSQALATSAELYVARLSSSGKALELIPLLGEDQKSPYAIFAPRGGKIHITAIWPAPAAACFPQLPSTPPSRASIDDTRQSCALPHCKRWPCLARKRGPWSSRIQDRCQKQKNRAEKVKKMPGAHVRRS